MQPSGATLVQTRDSEPVGRVDDPVVAPGAAPIERTGRAGALRRFRIVDDGAEQGEALAGIGFPPRQVADLVPEGLGDGCGLQVSAAAVIDLEHLHHVVGRAARAAATRLRGIGTEDAVDVPGGALLVLLGDPGRRHDRWGRQLAVGVVGGDAGGVGGAEAPVNHA